jgi:hypothetical protein
VVATKAALRATARMPEHADAVTYEVAPQLASLVSLTPPAPHKGG